MRSANLTFRYRVAPVPQIAAIHAQSPARRTISGAEPYCRESIRQSGVAFIQETAPGVVQFDAAEKTTGRSVHHAKTCEMPWRHLQLFARQLSLHAVKYLNPIHDFAVVKTIPATRHHL